MTPEHRPASPLRHPCVLEGLLSDKCRCLQVQDRYGTFQVYRETGPRAGDLAGWRLHQEFNGHRIMLEPYPTPDSRFCSRRPASANGSLPLGCGSVPPTSAAAQGGLKRCRCCRRVLVKESLPKLVLLNR